MVKFELKKQRLAAGDWNAQLTVSAEQQQTVLESLWSKDFATGIERG
jgi:hypothetical protein